MRLFFRRLARFLSALSLLLWAYRERHVLVGMVAFLRTVPARIRMGRGKEVALAAMAHWVLLRDPRLRGAEIRVGSIDGSTVVLCAPATETRANLARDLVAGLRGVVDVRLEDPAAHVQSDAGATVRLAG